MSGRDRDEDEAFSWIGDEEEGRTSVMPPLVDGTPASELSPDERAELDRQVPAPLLVGYGIVAGIALISMFGWGAVVFASTYRAGDALSEIMAQFGEFLAIASPALWFATAFFLTRGRRPVVRLLALLLGLLVTAPWPFVIGT